MSLVPPPQQQKQTQLVVYRPPEEEQDGPPSVPETSVCLLYNTQRLRPEADSSETASPRSSDEPMLKGLKRWRNSKSTIAGVGLGVVFLAVLGPLSGGIVVGIAGGLAGAYATKKVLKRREKRVVDKLMAAKYPLVYNEHAVYA